MPQFTELKRAVEAKIDELVKSGKTLYQMDINRDHLWETYLESIPAEHNPIFRERRVYDGNYDKNFIRRAGVIGAYDPTTNSFDTVWNLRLSEGNFFQPVIDRMHGLVSSANIRSPYTNDVARVGSVDNVDNYDSSIIWNHFYYELPKALVSDYRTATVNGRIETGVSIIKRSVTEASQSDIEMVLELIDSNAIYRGNEHEGTLRNWLKIIADYTAAPNADVYAWELSTKNDGNIFLRNTVIGTLITDLYNGVDIETAVKSFETKVAPSNYKRPTALVTQSMIREAQETLDELGYSDSIYRRFATDADIPGDKVLFRTQETVATNVFDQMAIEAARTTKKAPKPEEMSYDDFINLLPQLSKVELLPTRQLLSHRVALTAAANPQAPSIFKWDNSIAWSYIHNGGGADAIKERVKSMGGDVHGELRISLSWGNASDLDLHMANKSGQQIYFGDRQKFGGELDVDMNVNTNGKNFDDVHPVENISFKSLSKMPDGIYRIIVDCWNHRANGGFQIEIEDRGHVQNYIYDVADFRGRDRTVLHLTKTGDKINISIVDQHLKLVSETSPVGDSFVPVKSVILSPNHWDGAIGNKHLIFLTDDYEITEPVHGFFNEYLTPKLEKNRKVTAVLGTKLMINDGYTDASRGYGFSSTLKEEFTARLIHQNGRRQVVTVKVG